MGEKHTSERKQDNKTKESKTIAANTPPIAQASNAAIDQRNADHKINNSKCASDSTWSKWTAPMVVATLLLVIAATISAVISYHQWDAMQVQSIAMQEQLKEMKAARESQRAWIGIGYAGFSEDPKIGEPTTALIEYGNTGREPALKFVAEIKVSHLTLNEESMDTGIMNECMKAPLSKNGTVVYPDSFPHYSLSVPIYGKDVDAMVLTGKKSIFIEGCITYETLGTTHHSYFCRCYNHDFPTTNHFRSCLSGENAN